MNGRLAIVGISGDATRHREMSRLKTDWAHRLQFSAKNHEGERPESGLSFGHL
jgi:hypothetical protein